MPEEFEKGLIPVASEEPPEVIQARETEAKRVADEQAAVTQTKVDAAISTALDDSPNTAVVKKLAEQAGVSPEELQQIFRSAMTAQAVEIEALRAELALVSSRVNTPDKDGLIQSVGGYPWMYWRKPSTWPDVGSRGWISIGPGGQSPVSGKRDTGSYAGLLRKGLIPLPMKYGIADVPKSPLGVLDFLPLLQRNGAVEFPASQVIAYQWHIKPPIKGLLFPQYEAIKEQVKKYVCEACGKTMYFMPDDTASGDYYRAHLMGPHKYPFREAVEAVKQQGFNLTPFRPASIEQMTTPGAVPI